MAKTIVQTQQINRFIRQAVVETIREIFNDPDYGLPLTSQAIRRLKKSVRSKKAGRIVEFDEILKKHHK
jgi:hypothetical protein